MIVSYNKMVACFEPQKNQEKVEVVNGVRSAIHRTGLTRLEVKYGNRDIPEGSYIYVSTVLMRNQKWGQEVYDFENDRLLFVPEQAVMLIDRNADEAARIVSTFMSDVEAAVYRGNIHRNL